MRRILPVAALLFASAGCKENDGELLRQVARKTGDKLGSAARPVSAATTPIRGAMSDTGLAARVETRIRNDRYLAGARLSVRADGDGVVAITGTVTEPSIKSRALDLAKSTVGVEKVTDEVKVE